MNYKKIVLFSGSLTKDKGAQYLNYFSEKCKNYDFVVIGGKHNLEALTALPDDHDLGKIKYEVVEQVESEADPNDD